VLNTVQTRLSSDGVEKETPHCRQPISYAQEAQRAVPGVRPCQPAVSLAVDAQLFKLQPRDGNILLFLVWFFFIDIELWLLTLNVDHPSAIGGLL